jgi:hypothetical protein
MAVARLFNDDGAETLLGAAATEERFRALPLDQYQMLQFATHGLVRGDVPGLVEPALVLTPVDMDDAFNDGLLGATEIANLDLNARLVVLSACNTANVDLAAFGAQAQGLTTAFAVAGVPTTIASLWPVESTTSKRIMVQFYKHLLAPTAPAVAEAMRQSLADAIASAPSAAFRHPRFWAPFIVMGDGASKLDRNPPRSGVSSNAEMTEGGGEIVAAARLGPGFVTSEFGAAKDGRRSSVVTQRAPDGSRLWSKADPTEAAGKLVATGQDLVVAGRSSNASAAPVLRKLNGVGELLWRKEMPSTFSSATVAALTPLADDGVVAIIAPLRSETGVPAFDVLRIDANGREIKRATIPVPDLKGDIAAATFSIAPSQGSIFIALSLPTQIDPRSAMRDDFGYFTFCNHSPGAYLYKLDGQTLFTEAARLVPGMNIGELASAGSQLLYAGSTGENCRVTVESAAFGRVDAELGVSEIWRDDGAFSTTMIALRPARDGYVGVAKVKRELFVRDGKTDDGGQIALSAGVSKKHAAFDEDSVTEAAFLRFDAAGRLVDRRFVGAGLPIDVSGLILRAEDYLAYGSIGLNPWLGAVQFRN